MKQLFLSILVSFAIFTSQAQTNKVKLPKEDYLVTIITPYGNMIILLNDQTPEHKKNFIKLAQEHFFDSTTFHRVILDFMIQGGDPNSKDADPNNDGTGGPGYTLSARHDRSDGQRLRGL